jgi:hypothetical protein
MSPEERQLLAGLFERTKSAAANPRDQEAERFIIEQIKAQPAAPYLLAQTVIVQDQALQAANQRLQELEGRVRELESQAQKPASGGFLGGLFGGGVQQPPPPRPAPPPGYGQQPNYPPQQQGGPWGAQPASGYGQPGPMAQPGFAPPAAAPAAGGGFLKGALGAAAGVAGGVLLADSIRGLFHGGGGGLGGGGLGGGGLGIGSGYEHAGGGETVINNYYGDSPSNQPQDAGYSDADYGPNDATDADYDSDDGGFDSGGDGGFDV